MFDVICLDRGAISALVIGAISPRYARLELSEYTAAIIENTAAANVSNDASAYRGQHYLSRGSSNSDGGHFNNARGTSHRGNNYRRGSSSRRGRPNRVSNEHSTNRSWHY